jgi:putative ABC transport system substrate-binding protein
MRAKPTCDSSQSGEIMDLIVAHASPAIAALKQAIRTIAIVMAVVNDPVGQGFVASLAKPGPNITGFTLIDFEIVGKWVG